MTSRPAQPIAAPKAGRVPSAVEQPAAEAPSAGAAPIFLAPSSPAVERCWRRAAAPAGWNLPRDEFQAALQRSAAKRFAGAPADPAKLEAYLDALHAGDLALALACAAGNDAAWDTFMAEFRPELYRAARAICGAGGDAAARELADSLYADLYGLPADRQGGLRESGARRKSLFEYFHGRSKLSTWLHAVLSQRHVDEIRRARATEPLEDETGSVRAAVEAREIQGADTRSESPSGADPERARHLAALQAALAVALGALDPRDRLRLAYYYADGRTLAEIGRLLGEHEATVSRKLERTRRDVRSRVESWLRDAKKWNTAQVSACLECARGEWPFDLTAHLRPASAADGKRDATAISSSAAARKI